MASPTNKINYYAALYDWIALAMLEHVRTRFTDPTNTTILDVGAGWGKYGILFGDYQIDACEIWPPNATDEMTKHYRRVYLSDICNLKFDRYNIIIFGDVFEHIEREKAKTLLKRIYNRCDDLYVIVPYNYVQGEVDGNPFEEHKQSDLTPQLMATEYPELRLLVGDDKRGIYVKA